MKCKICNKENKQKVCKSCLMSEMGRMGGSVRSEAKRKANIENGKKGAKARWQGAQQLAQKATTPSA